MEEEQAREMMECELPETFAVAPLRMSDFPLSDRERKRDRQEQVGGLSFPESIKRKPRGWCGVGGEGAGNVLLLWACVDLFEYIGPKSVPVLTLLDRSTLRTFY